MSFSTRKTNKPVRSFASTTSTFSSGSIFQNRSAPHVNVYGTTTTSSSSSSVRFSFDNNRPISPSRSITSVPRNPTQKKTCMCSPTSHPGSFRCSLHKLKNSNNNNNNSRNNHHNMNTNTYPSNRLNARRSAMTNSLVRIGTVEGGDLVKRALVALIRPSSHQQRRRSSFQQKPSRLSVMSKAENV
ncbi:uncharacterized protein LOC143599028 [Bidens hawaiensis]|uniref:uncharacterized protein LOC143599028 n=1 Tax=Bidens hawaiensis TaxID=980011 RepID=UPI004049713C